MTSGLKPSNGEASGLVCGVRSRQHRVNILEGVYQLRKSRKSGWQRDPEGMRKRILEAAAKEFADHGLSGARIARIARTAGANKRMIYYHVGDKEQLYLKVLEGAYEHIRMSERALNLEKLDPIAALLKLMEFTWRYYLKHPEFLALLGTENLHRARHLKRSRRVKEMHSPFVALIADILRRGETDGSIRAGVDPVQLYISMASLSWFYLSNKHTLSVIFGRNLLNPRAKTARLAHMTNLLVAALGRPRTPQLDSDKRRPIEFKH
jgi:AcrR family transcriptional regulator